MPAGGVTGASTCQRPSSPDEPFATLETISPEMAKQYLATSKGNRRIHPGRVDAYTRDMQMNRWYVGATIKFDTDGALIDGHHRLSAVLMYGFPVRFLVIRKLPPESVAGIDVGQTRRHHQISKFAGENFSPRHFAIAKRIEYGFSNGSCLSYDESRDAILKYLDAINFAVLNAGKERHTNATVLAVVAKAWYSQDHDRLKQFLDVLKHGLATSEKDWGAVKLREYLTSAREMHISVDSPGTYLRVHSALHNFCKGKPVQILRPSTKDLFPLTLNADGKVVPA